MNHTREFIKQLGLPAGDALDLPTSPKRFPDGAQYRVEIPSVEGPKALAAVLEEAEKQKVLLQRVSQGSGIMLLTDSEIREMARLGHEAGIEVSLFVGPRAAWDTGAQIVTLVNTDKIAAKLLVLFPHQTEPEHTHPRLGDYAGKEETVRCEWGELYLYGPGQPTPNPKGHPPAHRRNTYTVWHEYVLNPGEQITFQPGTPHWFQAGPEGVVMWSFSTKAIDVQDVFTDPDVRRETVILDQVTLAGR